MRCTYCYLPDVSDRRRINVALVAKLADELASFPEGHCTEIRWHAGEPLTIGIDYFLQLLEPFEQLRRGGRVRHSLQTNALVNEAYMRLVDYKRMQWQNRAHFMAAAAQAMRRILVDQARRHNAKRRANAEHVSLDAEAVICVDRSDDFGALDDALNALAARAPRKAQVVELRFFGGLSVEETAEVLRVSPITVMREWKSAKAWLYRELAGPTANGQ